MEQTFPLLKEQILTAVEQKESLKIVGGNSKAFLGRTISGNRLEMGNYSGVISYEPTELYITVKAGTLLSEVNQVLAEQNQMLAFEPAQVNEKTTIGGVVATGLSGPRRPYVGSVRDFVLGIRCINGLGKEMSFGGQVMKNVAGYDLSRLLTGSYGTLGIICEVTLKVLPLPEFELTACINTEMNTALEMMTELSSISIPVSACCYFDDKLFVRFSGNEKVIRDTLKKFNLNEFEDEKRIWKELRDYKSAIFNINKPIWRLSVPVTSKVDLNKDEYLIDWAGSQYWLATDRSKEEMFSIANKSEGSAMLFLGGDHSGDVFQPLSNELFKCQKQIKDAFDPHRVFNYEKIYSGL